MLNDGLPNQICMQCVQYINRAYSFRQLCERSENALRELLGRPIQQTFLELKPLLATETLISNPIPEIITGVTESFQTPIPLNETFTVTQNINHIPNHLTTTVTENINKDSNNANEPSKNQSITENFISESHNFVSLSDNSIKAQEKELEISVASSIISSEETKTTVKDDTSRNESEQLESNHEIDSSKYLLILVFKWIMKMILLNYFFMLMIY